MSKSIAVIAREPARAAVILALALLALVLGLMNASAVHDLGKFELDRNAVAEAGPAGDDWSPAPPGADDFTGIIADPKPASIFTTGGSKDDLNVSSWKHTDGSVPDKDDITNAYAAAYTNGDLILYFGADRFANNGDANIAFWFFQNEIGLNANGTFSGVHAVGDALIVSEFSSGGDLSTIKVLEWLGDGTGNEGNGNVDIIAPTGVDCVGAAGGDDFCATTNHNGSGCVNAPWAYTPKDSNGCSAGQFPPVSFFEGGINITQLFGSDVCFSSFMAMTRSSSTVRAQLKDFVLGDINTCADVHVAKTSSVSSINAGGSYDYTITATNDGAGPAEGVVVTDDLDNDLVVNSANFDVDPGSGGGTGACVVGAGNTITCTLSPSTLATSDGNTTGAEPDTAVITINVTAPPAACGTVSNTSHVTAVNEPEGAETDNDSNTVIVTINCPDVHVAKSSSALTVNAGDSYTYTITVTNAGAGAATSVVVTDDLDNDLVINGNVTFDVDPNNAGGTGNCTVGAGNTISCSLGTLAANDGNTTGAEPDTARITANVTAPPAACGTVSNTSHVTAVNEPTADQTDNDSLTVIVTVNCPDVHVAKSSSVSSITAGGSYTYTITATNAGAGAAYGVIVTDNLDDDLTINGNVTFDVDPNTAGGTGNCTVGAGNTISCSLGTLAANDGNTTGAEPDTAVITANVTAPPAACPSVTNTSHITATNEPAADQTDNDSNPATVVTVNCPSVSVVKTAVANSNDCKFNIVVTAGGTGSSTNVVLTDTLPAICTTVGGPDSAACSVTAGLLTCNFGTMTNGSTRSINLTGPCPDIPNTASVTADVDTNTSDNSSSDTVYVNCVP